MSTIVFQGTRIPEKHLVQEQVYRYHPNSELKHEIIEELKKHIGVSIDHFNVELDIKIHLKEYDTKNTRI